MFSLAKKHAEHKGYDNLQDFIRETIREKLFEDKDSLSGLLTYRASESALAKTWLTKEEDAAWQHLQKEK